MAEMLTWPEATRLAVTFLLTLCVIAKTLALVLSYYRHPRSRSKHLENLLELSVLCQVFVCTLLYGQLVFNFELGWIAPTGHVFLRYAVFSVTVLLSAAVIVRIKKPWPVSVVIASGLTLPVVETMSGSAFAVLYLAAVFFWLLRSVHICILRAREIRTNLSVLSIKNAIDTLHSGVLFGTVKKNAQIE
ncbi:MAG: hypothetical protein AB7V55_05315, partial [Oscillospiraceae bacterium]